MTHKHNRATTIWTLALTSAALFMVSLDNLVVTTRLSSVTMKSASEVMAKVHHMLDL